MEKIITLENIGCFAYVNKDSIKTQIKGIVVKFFGLGHNRMVKTVAEEDANYAESLSYAEEGILYVFPYNNPWNWMNPQAVAYTDEVLDVLIGGLGLSDDIPIVYMGGSMGGMSALVYTRYAKRTPVACVVNCPVCDMPYHYTERVDLPRTLYSAFANLDMSLDEALRRVSPIDLVDEMPDVDYYIFHAEEDKAVNIDKHSVRFVEKMKKSHRITFHSVPEKGHCGLTPEAKELMEKYIRSAIDKK